MHFFSCPTVRFLFFVTVSQLVSVITDDLRSENITKTVNRPTMEYIHLFVAPLSTTAFFFLKARSIRMSRTHLNLHQVLNDTKRPKKWPWSLSGDNLMLTQVTYMHELPREYYKSECNEVLNWIRQMLRLCAILTLPPFGQSGLGKLWGKDETCA